MTQEKLYKKHLNSLDKSAILAKKAKILAMEKNWTYSQAVDYIEETEPDLAYVATFGEEKPEAEAEFMYTRAEADKLLTDEIQKKVNAGIPFKEASSQVFEDPANSEKVRSYSFNG
jgi:hypothetical protein